MRQKRPFALKARLPHQARPAFREWFGIMLEATPALRDLIAATIE